MANHHQGRTSRPPRSSEDVGNFWFPEMDAMTTEHVRQCSACAANSKTLHKEPFTMTPMPTAPWTDLSVHIYGLLRCGAYLLVIIEEHSRYPVVRNISSTSAKVAIPIMGDVFAMLGISERLKSDGGPPFNSHRLHVLFTSFFLKQSR